MFLVTYLVDGSSHEGYHNATVIACSEIDAEFDIQALDGAEDVILNGHQEPMRQFRWWYAESKWVEIRRESFSREVGSVVDDLPQIEWGYF